MESGIRPGASKLLGFFSWQGNNWSFEQSSWLSYLIIAIAFFIIFLMMIYKVRIYQYINFQSNNSKILKIFPSKDSLFQFIGYFGMFFFLLRIILLAVSGYPNQWELLPLHFCRLFLFLIFLAFIFKKHEFIKYFAFLSIGGAIIGLFISDLSNSPFWGQANELFPEQFGRGGFDIGLDSYIFWDYFLAHSIALIIPVFVLTILKVKITKRDSQISIIISFIFTIFIFFLNWLLFEYASREWKSNYFYIGRLVQITIFGKLSEWPLSLLTYIVLGIIIYYLIFWIWIFQDKFSFEVSKKYLIKKISLNKSQNWIFYNSKYFVDLTKFRNK
ncbi:TMEM164 family acyltransferase [[Mycoplasma] mobile]|uniref:Uncharacterized protein n=1 Tax=Mycoplasma mobile (strain ATCC 43663 / 163K / NCTC 11711) TaxID=267748 RepID=Q6KIA2_MYCM1|nr:YwaF family protein [[Mycoplasma] mobile]AAT27674.1 conserved hypothetical protein [Mycoplasma mobile 163K]